MVDFLRCLILFVVLLDKRWPLPQGLYLTLPFAVSLNLLATPFLVFNFGIPYHSILLVSLLIALPLFRRNHQRHDPAFHHRLFFDLAVVLGIGNKSIQNLPSQVYVLHLPAPEEKIDLNFILFLQKSKHLP